MQTLILLSMININTGSKLLAIDLNSLVELSFIQNPITYFTQDDIDPVEIFQLNGFNGLILLNLGNFITLAVLSGVSVAVSIVLLKTKTIFLRRLGNLINGLFG